MLETSDNSAADGLLRLVGGAPAVRAALAALHAGGIAIDRDEGEMLLDSHGIARPPRAARTPARLKALTGAVTDEKKKHIALQQFMADPRDHATPAAMAHLAARLWRGEVLTPASATFVKDELGRCSTGRRRIRAGLPPATPVADRTGTCYGVGDDDAPCANDVAVITLEGGKHVALAVYVESAGAPITDEERAIVAVARAVWERYSGPGSRSGGSNDRNSERSRP